MGEEEQHIMNKVIIMQVSVQIGTELGKIGHYLKLSVPLRGKHNLGGLYSILLL